MEASVNYGVTAVCQAAEKGWRSHADCCGFGSDGTPCLCECHDRWKHVPRTARTCPNHTDGPRVAGCGYCLYDLGEALRADADHQRAKWMQENIVVPRELLL